MAFNEEAFLAALEQARAALDEIEMAASKAPAEEPMEEIAEGEAPAMPPMPPKPLPGE